MSMTARDDQPLIGVIIRRHGEELVHYVADEAELEELPGQSSVERALALAGAWSDLDPDELLDALDEIRHQSNPTLPIDNL
jgi:hypothetical protein